MIDTCVTVVAVDASSDEMLDTDVLEVAFAGGTRRTER